MSDDTPIGTTTFNSCGKEVKLVSKQIVKEDIDYYNVITYYHMNLFTNGILTSCRYSNLYPIENMKYVKDNRKLNKKDDLNINNKWFEGLRVAEQDLNINKDGNSYMGDTILEHINILEQLDIKNQN